MLGPELEFTFYQPVMIQRILIAEDADTLRDVLATVLETEGYSVDSFPDAESALKQATQVEYDLILSDFKLPKMNGIEFLEQLRKERPNTPFLLMTAYGSIDIAVTAMKQGANDFICKPFEPRELCTMIGQVLTHHRVIDRSLGKEQRKVRSFLTLSLIHI